MLSVSPGDFMDNEQKKVSVIIPVYNHENYLEYAIRSVCEQYYDNIELIVINDGSRDNSHEKILALKEELSFLYVNQENRGLSQTLINGLKLCTGDYIALLASDDIWLKDKVSKQVEHMAANPDTVACCALVNVIDENNDITKACSSGVLERYDFERILKEGFNIPPATIMIDNKKLQADFFDPELKVEDLYLWLKLTEHGGYLDVLPDGLANYRIHSSNTTGNLALIAKYHHLIIDRFYGHKFYGKAKIIWSKFSFRQLTRHYKMTSLNYVVLHPAFIFSKEFILGLIKLMLVWDKKKK